MRGYGPVICIEIQSWDGEIVGGGGEGGRKETDAGAGHWAGVLRLVMVEQSVLCSAGSAGSAGHHVSGDVG